MEDFFLVYTEQTTVENDFDQKIKSVVNQTSDNSAQVVVN